MIAQQLNHHPLAHPHPRNHYNHQHHSPDHNRSRSHHHYPANCPGQQRSQHSIVQPTTGQPTNCISKQIQMGLAPGHNHTFRDSRKPLSAGEMPTGGLVPSPPTVMAVTAHGEVDHRSCLTVPVYQAEFIEHISSREALRDLLSFTSDLSVPLRRTSSSLIRNLFDRIREVCGQT
ncbi:unnamed protein product [Protopolystoma xenopodis]|uniref:Uncharacterized protein n=1 Tax=Protopolystoma xenopodis TaxID=117903 RepID=A0A448WP30_9PLAT|nr:unnamed protein product [Protopolystoma xenopodis]